MTVGERDDCPTMYRLSRRQLLICGTLIAGSLSFPGLAAYAAAVEGPAFQKQFMELSSLLIQHHLDPVTGQRMASKMLALNPSLAAHVAAIIQLAKSKNAKIVEDFFPDIPDGELKDAAFAIISAWYLGVAEDKPNAEVFAFEDALIYKPTSDIMTIPSYAKSKPNGWNANAPPLSDMPAF
jgi:hypothetical protein